MFQYETTLTSTDVYFVYMKVRLQLQERKGPEISMATGYYF